MIYANVSNVTESTCFRVNLDKREQERVYWVEESDSGGKGQWRLKTVDDKDSECEETDSVSSVMDNPNKRPKICEEGKDQVNVLPEKILLKIFGYLSNTDLNAAKLVCKKWRMIGETETLWSQLPLSINNGNMLAMPRILKIRRLELLKEIFVEIQLGSL